MVSLSPAHKHFDAVRARIAVDPSHSFAQHLQCLLAEIDVTACPLPSDPTRMSDADRHRWFTFVSTTMFMSYRDAAVMVTTRIFPQLREQAELRAERAVLAARIAAARPAPPPPPPTAAELRMAARLERNRNRKDAAREAAVSSQVAREDTAN